MNSLPQPTESLQHELLRREEWLRLAAEGSQLGLWFWSEVGNTLFWDAKTREIFGIPQHVEMTLETFYDAVHPDDRVRTQEIWRYQLENAIPYELEYRAKRPDGSVRWVSARGRGHYDEAGKPQYMVGVVFDITKEKEAEIERAELSGRLIVAQEEERAYIARELHDDFSQRLALLQSELGEIARLTTDVEEVSARLFAAENAVMDIANDIRSLSHQLHSAHLKLLGLVASARSHCASFEKRRDIKVDFTAVDVPASMPFETSLALFRIMQEAMSNARKHSKASNIQVRLWGNADGVSLSVCDDGIGIDLDSDYVSNGIGISSMKERTRMLSGVFELRSGPSGRGIEIAVSVPNVH